MVCFLVVSFDFGSFDGFNSALFDRVCVNGMISSSTESWDSSKSYTSFGLLEFEAFGDIFALFGLPAVRLFFLRSL